MKIVRRQEQRSVNENNNNKKKAFRNSVWERIKAHAQAAEVVVYF